jgi:hypothetical protein
VPIANSIGAPAGVSLLWLGAQPEGPAQDPALPDIGKLAGLIWMHVIHLPPSRWEWR